MKDVERYQVDVQPDPEVQVIITVTDLATGATITFSLAAFAAMADATHAMIYAPPQPPQQGTFQ